MPSLFFASKSNLTEKQILESVTEDKIDWMKISKLDVNFVLSSFQIRIGGY